MELQNQYNTIELNLKEDRPGERYNATVLLRRNDVDDRSKAIATCHTLAEFLLIVPKRSKDGTARSAYDILLQKLGFLHGAINDIRQMAERGRSDGRLRHSVVDSYFATYTPKLDSDR